MNKEIKKKKSKDELTIENTEVLTEVFDSDINTNNSIESILDQPPMEQDQKNANNKQNKEQLRTLVHPSRIKLKKLNVIQKPKSKGFRHF